MAVRPWKIRPISPSQIRAVRARQQAIGMDDDTYRALLRREFAVDSELELSVRQANRLLRFLFGSEKVAKYRQVVCKSAASGSAEAGAGGAIKMVSAGERELIAKLVAGVRWRHENGYVRWLSRSHGLPSTGPRTHDEAAAVIEGLKGMS